MTASSSVLSYTGYYHSITAHNSIKAWLKGWLYETPMLLVCMWCYECKEYGLPTSQRRRDVRACLSVQTPPEQRALCCNSMRWRVSGEAANLCVFVCRRNRILRSTPPQSCPRLQSAHKGCVVTCSRIRHTPDAPHASRFSGRRNLFLCSICSVQRQFLLFGCISALHSCKVNPNSPSAIYDKSHTRMRVVLNVGLR